MPAAPKNTAAKPASAAAPAKSSATKAAVTAAGRQAMIAEAAYFLAQKRGFGGGKEAEDWSQAEQQVDAALKKSK